MDISEGIVKKSCYFGTILIISRCQSVCGTIRIAEKSYVVVKVRVVPVHNDHGHSDHRDGATNICKGLE